MLKTRAGRGGDRRGFPPRSGELHMFRRFAVCALTAAVTLSLVPARSPAASKEIMELQRDVAGLQEQLRLLKESQDKQLAALTVLVQQALDTSKTSTTGVAVIQNNLQQKSTRLNSSHR